MTASSHARRAREAVAAFLLPSTSAPSFGATVAELRAEVGLTALDVPDVDPDCLESGVYRGARSRRWPWVSVVWEETQPDPSQEHRMARSRVAVYVTLPDARVAGDASNAGLASEVYADALMRMLDRGVTGPRHEWPGATLNGAVLSARVVQIIAAADPAVAAGENVTIKATIEVVTAQEGD